MAAAMAGLPPVHQRGQHGAAAGSNRSDKNKQRPPTGESAEQTQEAIEALEQDNNPFQAEEEGDELPDTNDVYHPYNPAKNRDGQPHPTPIVETASLASIAPPDITYEHHLQDIVAAGHISNAQLETVLYAMMRFNRRLADDARAGFFLGDGAGVGKGRQIAAVIKEFWASGGRRILWVSTSQDLRFDAQRDLADVAADIPVYPKAKGALPNGPLASHIPSGIVFVTYALLIGKSLQWEELRGAAAAAAAQEQQAVSLVQPGYSGSSQVMTLAGATAPPPKVVKIPRMKKDSRLLQMVTWLGGKDRQGDCLVVFDECHKAKNLVPEDKWKAGNNKLEGSLTGWAVETLQKELPNARILYSSATGATEPRNMMYMTRLGTAGFQSMHDLIKSLDSAGLGALELFCMGLKSMGIYLSRSLSYDGAEFDMHRVLISQQMRVIYDRSTDVWALLFNLLRQLTQIMPKHGWALFWSAHQRFFRQMLIAAKVPDCARLAIDAVNAGQCVVIGLQSTGEQNTSEIRAEKGDTLEDLVSAPQAILKKWVTKWFPTRNRAAKKQEKPIPSEQLDVLVAQVAKAMEIWSKMPGFQEASMKRRADGGEDDAEDEVSEAALGRRPAPHLGARRTVPEAATTAGPARSEAGSSMGPRGAAAARAGALVRVTQMDDDQDVVIAGERELEDILEERRLAAIRTGNLLDLTEELDSRALQHTLRNLEAAEEAEKDASLQQRQEQQDREQQQARELALEELREAQRELEELMAGGPSGGGREPRPQRQRSTSRGEGSADDPMLMDDSDDDFAAVQRRPRSRRRAALNGSEMGQVPMAVDGEGAAAPQPNRLRRKRLQVLASSSDSEGGASLPGRKKQSCSTASAPAVLITPGKAAAAPAPERRRAMVIDDSDDEVQLVGERGTTLAQGGASRRSAIILDDDDKLPQAQATGTKWPLTGSGVKPADPAAAANKAAPLLDLVSQEDVFYSLPGSRAQPADLAATKTAPLDLVSRDDDELPASEDDEMTSPFRPARRRIRAAKAVVSAERTAATPDALAPEMAVPEAAPLEAAGAAPAADAAAAAETAVHADVEVEEAAEDAEEVEVDTPCEVCGEVDEEEGNSILLCDGCDAGCHMHCLRPKLVKVPEGEWFCGKCSKARSKGRRRAAVRGQENDPEWAIAVAPAHSNARPPLGPIGNDDKAGRKALMQQLAARKRVEEAQARLEALQGGQTSTVVVAVKAESEPGAQLSRRATRGSALAPSYSMDRVESMKLTVKHKQIKDGWDRELEDGLDSDYSEAEEAGGSEDESAEPVGPACRQLQRIQKMLLRLVDGLELPANPLDQLVDLLGGESKVAEMTGRKGGLVRREDGRVSYKQRGEDDGTAQKMLNIVEQRAFMDGHKLVAIISEAASTGISLQADKRSINTRRRCHLTLELPWSADKAIQQFGRTHRSNQESSPIYRMVVAQCGGEYRFAAAVAKRLLSLGALLKGDRRALDAGTELKDFDVDNKWGKQSLERVVQDVTMALRYDGDERMLQRLRMPGVPEPRLPRDRLDPSPGALRPLHQFYNHLTKLLIDMGLVEMAGGMLVVDSKKKPTVAVFLNRLLGQPLTDQELLFGYFWDTLDAIIKRAKSEGKFDDGITTLKPTMAAVIHKQLLHTDVSTSAKTWHTQVAADWGVSYSEAKEMLDKFTEEETAAGRQLHRKVGFCKDGRSDSWFSSGHPLVVLITEVRKAYSGTRRFFRITRPNGKRAQIDDEELGRWSKLNDLDRAKTHWQHWFQFAGKHCSHGPRCTQVKAGRPCDYGMRIKNHTFIAGAVLPLWRLVDDHRKSSRKPLHVKRIQLTGGEPLVGLLLESSQCDDLMDKIFTQFGPPEEAEDGPGLPPRAYIRD